MTFDLPRPYAGPLLPYHPDPPSPPRGKWAKRWLKATRGFAATIDYQSAHGRMRGLRADLTVTAKYLRTGQWHGALDNLFAALAARGCSPDLIVNIGANNGCTVLPVLKHGFAKRAIAIEPEPANVELLRHNLRIAELEPHTLLMPIGVSDRDGELELETSPTNKADHRFAAPGAPRPPGWKTVNIPVRRIDDVVAPICASLPAKAVFTWMDIQGAEPMAVGGGAGFFRRFPFAVLEFFPRAMARLGATRGAVADAYEAIWTDAAVLQPDGDWAPAPPLRALWDQLGETGAETDVLLWRAP